MLVQSCFGEEYYHQSSLPPLPLPQELVVAAAAAAAVATVSPPAVSCAAAPADGVQASRPALPQTAATRPSISDGRSHNRCAGKLLPRAVVGCATTATKPAAPSWSGLCSTHLVLNKAAPTMAVDDSSGQRLDEATSRTPVLDQSLEEHVEDASGLTGSSLRIGRACCKRRRMPQLVKSHAAQGHARICVWQNGAYVFSQLLRQPQ